MACHGMLTGLQQNIPVAVLLYRQSNIAFASKPIGTIELSSLDKTVPPIGGGIVTLQRNNPIQLTGVIHIEYIEMTYMYMFESANISGRRMQIFELSGFGHFSTSMFINPLFEFIGSGCRLLFSPDNSLPFLQTNTSSASLG